MNQPHLRWWIVAVILCGTWLRVKGLFDNSFYTDEALFASWARLIATGRDPLLQTQLVDKPPLLFYAQAVAFRLLRPTEWAARLPNWWASIVLIPLVYRWMCGAWRDQMAGLLAAMVIAFSPLAIQFSATAFTDPLMLTFVVAALASKGAQTRGIWFGLALATKYQAMLLLPLLWRRRPAWRSIIGCVLVIVCWMAWSGQPFFGSGDALLISTLRPITTYELLPRWQQWQTYLDTVLGVRLLWLFGPMTVWIAGNKRSPRDQAVWLLLISYVCFHWLLATAQYDRYMLPVVVLTSVLVGRMAATAWRQRPAHGPLRHLWAVLLLIGGLLLAFNGDKARRGHYLVGGQPNADEGAADFGRYFADAPYGTVLYDHWYSWQWRYHLLETGVYVEWTPDPATVVQNLNVFYDAQRYIVLPSDERAVPFQRTLRNSGYRLQKRLQSDEMILYQIMRTSEQSSTALLQMLTR